MKGLRYLFMITILGLACACDRSDEADFDLNLPDGPSFDESTTWGQRMKAFYDKWGVWCQINVPANDLNYAWTTGDNWSSSSIDYLYEEANVEYIEKALDFLDEEVMVNLPSSILDEYMGLYIALEGRMYNSYGLEDYLEYSSLEDYPDLTTEFDELMYGWNGARFLLLAPVGPEFDEIDKDQLKREWTALIFYEALKNLPNPDEFEQANQSAWDNWLGYFYYEYIIGDHEDRWEEGNIFFSYDPYSDGLVSPGALVGVTLYDGYDDETAKTGFYLYYYKWYDAQTCLDAFADYVAYIMYASAEEKAEVRSMSSNIIKNEELVKEYCKQYLDWDIPELGE